MLLMMWIASYQDHGLVWKRFSAYSSSDCGGLPTVGTSRPLRTRTTVRGPSIRPLVHMDGGRMYPKFSSISWADLDRGPRFFLVSGRRWTRFLSGPSTSWTDLDAGPGLSFLRWTSGRMDGPTHGPIRTADPDYDIWSGRPDGWTGHT